ncbi:hypothetical protein PTTG_11879 [Puccinia triticina 1-1 BBBD Race 1]|uniref:Rpr2-domain-containing protein n=1 Tax=Puccinia triticina (isolate 1-1 / race 1 (BBBD)) TaxID=630390 RepID=A0A180GBL2_PUCT1|nr:hypothetical protein PTTG_11879 [Puccinia triticina 1-1 BBBD Race 1]WAR60896.1 hypothetical protein PtB15_13B145 [Puccinia triticina]
MAQKNPKRGAAQGPNPKAVQNGEVLQRLNFLHQAAHYLATVTSTPSEPGRAQVPRNDHVKPNDSRKAHKPRSQGHGLRQKKQNRKAKSCQPIANLPILGLSRILTKSMKVISKKAVVRMDPSVKRSICRSCHLLLIPGHTSTTRVLRSSSHRHKVNVTCSACQHQRKIPHPPEPKAAEPDPNSPTQPTKTSSKKLQRRPIPFWRQPQHITFAAQTVVEGAI